MSNHNGMEAVNLTKHPLTPEKESSYENHEIRVITYNIHSCVDKKRNAHPEIIAGIIDNLQADIVCLQEVDAQKPLSINHNQARTIAKKLSMDYIFFPVEEIGLHSFGLAILSRYSFQDYHRSYLPNLFPRLKPRKRGAIRASVLTPAGSIHIINVHLSLFKLERRKQIKILLGKDWLLKIPEDEPLIFCGDLNAGPSSKTYRTLSRYLTDVQKDIKKSRPSNSRPTFHSKSPLFRIDHIFVSHHVRTLNVEVQNTPDTQTASDHLPLIADLAIKKPN